MAWKIGIIGAGTISAAYLEAARSFEALEVVAIADLDVERSEARAKQFGVPRALTVDGLLADPEVDTVLNLTVPAAHAEVSLAALNAGKHVYLEKPLAIDRTRGEQVIERAASRGLRVGCAPDTPLGPGLQTSRAVLDEGAIGFPIAATAVMASRGPDAWHPNPDFFYAAGAGPLFDFGPYYLSALVNLLGPIEAVAATATIGLPERTIRSGPRAGATIRPETPTHVTALLRFVSGVTATLLTSFDVVASEHPRIELYGSEGTLSVPDPNTFGGPVRLRRIGDDGWSERALLPGPSSNDRGIGLAEMAEADARGRAHRASGALALHVLDAMETILKAAEEGRWLPLTTRTERPAPLGADAPARHALVEEAS